MTSQKHLRRNKQEYEDLDEICSASTKELDRQQQQQQPHYEITKHFRQKPAKFPSDTAINLSRLERHNFKKLNVASGGSIPCIFYVGLNVPATFLNQNDATKDSQTKSGEANTKKLPLTRKFKYWLFFIFYIFLYMLYLLAGAFCFQLIEKSQENKLQAEFVKLRNNFLNKYPQIIESDFNDILISALTVSNSGVKIATNSTISHRHIGDLVLFTTSMVTTIGYGHVSPLTAEGKVFCIIYAAIGIPLTLVLISITVKHLFKQTNKLFTILLRRFRHASEMFSIQMIHLSILAASFSILFIIIPAVIYSSIEDEWSFLDGIYFCFTSLTTIGLGDIVPDTNDSYPNGVLYKILTAFYLIFGLIGIMLVVTVFYTIPQLNIGVYLIENYTDEVEKVHSINQVESTASSSKTLRTIL